MKDQNHLHEQNEFAVVPNIEKLNANRSFRGNGVVIAFLDSGFYPHPDYSDRVIAFYDVSGEEKEFGGVEKPEGLHWHGTQTVVACAGAGQLSDGFYTGIASESELVLVKVSSDGGKITDKNIEKGLQWLIDKCEEYDVKILNISVSGDENEKTKNSKINQLAEKLVEKGVTITAAAGNSMDSSSNSPG